MVQGIGNNGIFRAEQGLKQTAVGVEAGRVQNRIFHAEERSQFALQRLVAVLGAADEAHGGHAKTVGVHARLRGSDQLRVIRKT